MTEEVKVTFEQKKENGKRVKIISTMKTVKDKTEVENKFEPDLGEVDNTIIATVFMRWMEFLRAE